MSKMCVVYATNGNSIDVMRMTWSIRSLIRHSGALFDVAILSDQKITTPSGIDFSDTGRRFFVISDMRKLLLSSGIFSDHWSRKWPFEVIYRLGIPKHPAFREYSRVLYLDTDTLVLSDKVDRLLSADISGFEVCGTYDIDGDNSPRIENILKDDLTKDNVKRLTEKHGDTFVWRAYVNAGVLLFNVEEILADEDWYDERLVMFWKAQCRGKFAYLDQDFVNSMMRVKADMSTMFNWQRGGYPENCIIRHYITNQKNDMLIRAVDDLLI